jgi:hypothetical protein
METAKRMPPPKVTHRHYRLPTLPGLFALE